MLAITAAMVVPHAASGKPDPKRVKLFQQKLFDLGYWLPEINGSMDYETIHAVIAFQKVAKLKLTGELDYPTKQAIDEGIRPKARRPGSNVSSKWIAAGRSCSS